jgi:hypothetical protein
MTVARSLSIYPETKLFYGSCRRHRNYIWTKQKTEQNQKGRNQADSWAVDTLESPQEQANKRKALTRQEHKKLRRKAKLILPLILQI